MSRQVYLFHRFPSEKCFFGAPKASLLKKHYTRRKKSTRWCFSLHLIFNWCFNHFSYQFIRFSPKPRRHGNFKLYPSFFWRFRDGCLYIVHLLSSARESCWFFLICFRSPFYFWWFLWKWGDCEKLKNSSREPSIPSIWNSEEHSLLF